MRRLPLLLAVAALAFAGCGSDGDLAPQVPGQPAGVELPDGEPVPGGADGAAGDDTATGDTGTTDDAGATDETTAPTDQSGAATAPASNEVTADSGGATTAPATDGPTGDTPPPAGSEAEVFEDFCTQNPGAC